MGEPEIRISHWPYGQDVSIGYLSHTDAAIRLYLQETFTFLLLTSEASVALAPPEKARET